MRDQPNHPLEGLLSEKHREHFYTKEEYDRSRELRGEKGETKLKRLIDSLKESLPEVEDEGLREKLSELIDDITKSALRYINARIELVRTSDQAYKDKDAIMSADRSRRSTHLRLVDSIRIACRNMIQNVEGFQLETDVADLIGDSEDERVRDRVSHAAIDLVWELLNREEDEQLTPNK